MEKFTKEFRFNPTYKLQEFLVFRWLSAVAKKNLAAKKPQVAIFAFDYIGNSINWNGRFEEEELGTAFDFLAGFQAEFKSGTCLDVGANIGNHSLFFSQFFEKVHSYEPSGRIFPLLKINSQLSDKIVPHQVGLAAQKRTVKMYSVGSNIGESSIVENWKSNDETNGDQVDLETLDSMSGSLGSVKLIKIDVEGMEEEVIRGGRELLAKLTPAILFEQHHSEFDGNESPTIRLLRELGYEMFLIVKRRTGGNLMSSAFSFLVKCFAGTKYLVERRTSLEAHNYSNIIALHRSKFAIDRTH